MTNPVWNGLEINTSLLRGYRHAEIVSYGGQDVERWVAYFTAGMDEVGVRIGTTAAALRSVSSSNIAISAGAKSGSIETGKGFAAGDWVIFFDPANPTTKYIVFPLTTYDSATGAFTGTVGADDFVGTGSHANWTVRLSAQPGPQGPPQTFASDSEAQAASLADKAVTPANLAAATIMQGVHYLPYPGNALLPLTTNGGVLGSFETATHDGMVPYAEFSESTTTYFSLAPGSMPPAWNGGTVTFNFLGLAASGSGDVKIFMQARSRASGDAIDAAWGTAVGVTLTSVSTTAEKASSFSGAVTIANSPSPGDAVEFRFYRDPSDGSDTLTGKFWMTRFNIAATFNAKTDA